jgi:hypothetical protein
MSLLRSSISYLLIKGGKAMKKIISHRVVTFLDRQELDFLDHVTKDIFFSKGVKIPRSALLRIIIDIFIFSQNCEIKKYDDLLTTIIEKINRGVSGE